MWTLISENWVVLTGFIGAGFALWRYLDSRKRELCWSKTKFLFEQAHYLDCDPDVMASIEILSDENPEASVDDIFGADPDQVTRRKYLPGFEKLFNFLDRLAHAYYSLNTLGLEEIGNFKWHLDAIQSSESVGAYCRENGYGDVMRLADDLSKKKKK